MRESGHPYPSPELTSLKSCLITDEESEPILQSYQTFPYPPITRGVLPPSPLRTSFETTRTKSSSLSAFFHIVCVMAGTGILQLPFALKAGGWLAIVWIIVSGYLVYHSGRMLNQCLYYDGFNRLSGLIDIGGTALGKPGKRLVEFAFGTLIIGVSGLYLILAASNLKLLLTWVGWSRRECHDYFFSVLIIGGYRVFACSLFSCIPFITFKTLKEASLLSFFGVVSISIMVLVISVVAFSDYQLQQSTGDLVRFPTGPPDYQWLNWASLPLSLASISFSFGGNTVFPHVEKSMQNPKAFNQVLRAATLFVTVLYVLIAGVGYLAYGDDAASPIFRNLQSSPAVTTALVMLTLHVLLTIPINLTSFALDAENSLGLAAPHLSYGEQAIYRITFRVCLSAATFTIAILFPYFEHIIELLGAFSTGILLFILPPIFYIRLFGWHTCSRFDRYLALFMGGTGVTVLLIGTFQAIVALYHDVLRHRH